MRKAVLFEVFAHQCPFFYSFGRGRINNGYNCKHPKQESVEDVGYKEKKKCGCCYSFSCPLGIEAEQRDLTGKSRADAIKDKIDWEVLREDEEISEGEFLLVNVGEDATQDEKDALYSYDLYMHRYDNEWLNGNGIDNNFGN